MRWYISRLIQVCLTSYIKRLKSITTQELSQTAFLGYVCQSTHTAKADGSLVKHFKKCLTGETWCCHLHFFKCIKHISCIYSGKVKGSWPVIS